MTTESSAIETLLEVMRRRRNIRKFKPDPVPDEYLRTVIEAARLASSGANTQPWEFIVIRDPERKKRVAQIFFEAAEKGVEVDPRFPRSPGTLMVTKFIEAPVLLAVCADPRFKAAFPGYGFRDSILEISMGAAMEHIHLAATALGLASCWGTINQFSEGPIGEFLGVQPPLVVKEVFSLGFPVAAPSGQRRRELSSVLHYEQLDASGIRSDEEIANMIATRRNPDIYSGVRAEAAS